MHNLTHLRAALVAVGLALSTLASAQVPQQQAPSAATASPETIKALAAYQRGATMQRNAAARLCQAGMTDYCASAGPTQAQAPANVAPLPAPRQR